MVTTNLVRISETALEIILVDDTTQSPEKFSQIIDLGKTQSEHQCETAEALEAWVSALIKELHELVSRRAELLAETSHHTIPYHIAADQITVNITVTLANQYELRCKCVWRNRVRQFSFGLKDPFRHLRLLSEMAASNWQEWPFSLRDYLYAMILIANSPGKPSPWVDEYLKNLPSAETV